MNDLMPIILAMYEQIKEIKVLIHLLKQSRAEVLKDTWVDNQDVLQMLHISKRTLQTFRSNGTLPYSKVSGKFYYKVSDIEELFKSNYYNHNFKTNGK